MHTYHSLDWGGFCKDRLFLSFFCFLFICFVDLNPKSTFASTPTVWRFDIIHVAYVWTLNRRLSPSWFHTLVRFTFYTLVETSLGPDGGICELGNWCSEPSQPLGIISWLKETFIKRYIVETTNKTEMRPEEQRKKTESCRENLWNEIQLKRPKRIYHVNA